MISRPQGSGLKMAGLGRLFYNIWVNARGCDENLPSGNLSLEILEL